MSEPFTRRDFLNASPLASGAVLAGGATPLQLLAAREEGAAFDGYGGIGDYARAHGDTWADVVEGHRIRDRFSGFDAARDMAGLVLNRWGHAYLSPEPGFFFGKDGQPAPGEVLRARPVGRVAFANSDLAGIMDHRASILEADRAVSQVLSRL